MVQALVLMGENQGMGEGPLPCKEVLAHRRIETLEVHLGRRIIEISDLLEEVQGIFVRRHSGRGALHLGGVVDQGTWSIERGVDVIDPVLRCEIRGEAHLQNGGGIDPGRRGTGDRETKIAVAAADRDLQDRRKAHVRRNNTP